MLEELLTLGLRPEQCNDSERTALHFAASAGDLDSCRSLLAASTDSKMLLNCQDWEGATAVHLSIKSGHASTCRFLFEATADLQEIMDFGVTPLQVAADLGHSEVLQLLLEDLLHPNQPKEAFQRALQGRQGDGRGAWLVACANGRLACARLLHQAAEKVQIDLLKEEDRNKRKALILAALGGHLEVSWLFVPIPSMGWLYIYLHEWLVLFMVDVGKYPNTWMVWGLFLFVKVLGELQWGDGQKMQMMMWTLEECMARSKVHQL